MTRGVLVLGLVSLMATSCGAAGGKATDAAAGGDATSSHVVGLDALPDGVAAPADHPSPPPDAQLVAPGNLSVPDPPPMSCGGDAGDCDFPPSVCGQTCPQGTCVSKWVVYFDNPRCVDGTCVFDRRYFQCASSSFCTQGGCIPNFTAPP